MDNLIGKTVKITKLTSSFNGWIGVIFSKGNGSMYQINLGFQQNIVIYFSIEDFEIINLTNKK
jgi:hypothetical protein